jgi:hypothetical protein
MAREPRPTDVQKNIDATMRDTSTPEQAAMMDEAQQAQEQVYKLDPKTKIPVSKIEGSVWKSRKTGNLKRMSWLFEAWNEAEAYYSAGQMDHRRGTGGESKGNDVVSKNRGRKFSSTDNQVYATVNAVIPTIYAKNPEIEITMNKPSMEMWGTVLKHFGNNIAKRKDAPGINLKPKARKNVMRCEVTNEAWMLVGYVKKDVSADQAREDIVRIGKELAAAENESDIKRLEGELMALEETCDILDPAGPFCRTLRGDQVIVDDDSTEDDHSDANWMMAQVWFPTVYLNARYRQKDDKGNYVSPYKPSHVVDARTNNDAQGITDLQREIDSFHIFEQGLDSPNQYGYDDRSAYERAKRTKCWYCFDKVKRRFYLYADNDFTWPVWVFDDPYHLPTFFPLFKLQYHTDPKLNRTKGEVSHYLDQQDTINQIDDELNRARTALQDRGFIDSDFDQKKVEELLLSVGRKWIPLKAPDGKTLKDAVLPPPMPSLQYEHLWDKSGPMQSINQISGVMEAIRGEQFKTNTTNKAIEVYSSNSNVRLDEKRDAIEDHIGEVMWAVIFLCLQFMTPEEITDLSGVEIPPEQAQMMTQMTPEQIRKTFTCSCVGGSTQKPTSASKKAEALQVGQILGQFGGSPYAAVLAIRMMSRAFDGMVITAQDWQMLLQTMMMSLQKAGAGPQGANPDAAQEGTQEDQAEGGEPSEEEVIKEVQARAKAQGKTVTPMQAKAAVQRRAANGAH